MELGKFREDPIAGVLEQNYVEARLHTDGQVNIDRIRELQERYVGDPGLPNYVVVDPETLESVDKYEGICLTEAETQAFVAFLEKGARAARS